MAIVLNGTTGITAPDIDATAQSTDIASTGDLSCTDLSFDSGYGSAATAYGCRAWVNFNGTGTVAIRESGNVSSITDNGTGQYTVNFTTAMPDANYSATCAVDKTGGNSNACYNAINTYTTSSVNVVHVDTAAFQDVVTFCVAVFR